MKTAHRLPSRCPPAPPHQLLDRGVWKAPWMGPQGEMVLLAVTSGHQLLGTPRLLPFGSDYLASHDAMWDLLDTLDPVTEITPQRALQVI